MNKKITLLGLAVVSAAVLALPAIASALVPLHLSPTPSGARPIDGVGKATLSTLNTSNGSTSTITCDGVTGSVNFETGGTTGTMNLTFGGNCRESIFNSLCTSTNPAEPLEGNISTTTLPFHLVTVPGSPNQPGVLVTPSTDGSFAHIKCFGGLVNFTVTGNGVIGTITKPACGGSSAEATISFTQSSAGIQSHRTVVGTSTEYSLQKGAEDAAQVGHATVTLGGNTELICT